MLTGFVKLPRAFFKLPFWQTERRYSRAEAIIDLFQRAAYHPDTIRVKQQKINIQPGQLICSKKGLAEEWGWEPKAVRDFLTVLEASGLISLNCVENATIITLYFHEKTNKQNSHLSDFSTEHKFKDRPPVSSEVAPHSKKVLESILESRNNSKKELLESVSESRINSKKELLESASNFQNESKSEISEGDSEPTGGSSITNDFPLGFPMGEFNDYVQHALFGPERLPLGTKTYALLKERFFAKLTAEGRWPPDAESPPA